MLFLSIPKGQTTGECRINGKQVEFRIENRSLASIGHLTISLIPNNAETPTSTFAPVGASDFNH